MSIDKNSQVATGFFKDGKLNQHLHQQLELMGKNLVKLRAVANRLCIYLDIPVENLANQKHQASFALILTKSYPLKAPRVYLLNDLVAPRINDWRDLLENILRSRWSYLLKLEHIYSKLHSFCGELFQLEGKPLQLQRLGRYYPGQKTPQQLIQGFPIQKFEVVEKDKKDEKRLLGISQLHFMIWRVDKETLQLELAGPIQAVSQIYNSRQGQIILKIKKFKNLRQFSIIQKKLVFSNGEMQNQFTRILLKTITTLQTVKISFEGRKDSQNELVAKEIKNIQNKQQQLAKNPSDKEAFDSLNRLYQEIIDYYSLRGDYLYLIYVHKMNTLIKLIKA